MTDLAQLTRSVKRSYDKKEDHRKRLRKWEERYGEQITALVHAKEARAFDTGTQAQQDRYLAIASARQQNDLSLRALTLAPGDTEHCWRFRNDSQLPVQCYGGAPGGCFFDQCTAEELQNEYDGYYENQIRPTLQVCRRCFEDRLDGDDLELLSMKALHYAFGDEPPTLRQFFTEEDDDLAPEDDDTAVWRATRPGPPDQWRVIPGGMRLRCIVRTCERELATRLLIGCSRVALCEEHFDARTDLAAPIRAAVSNRGRMSIRVRPMASE